MEKIDFVVTWVDGNDPKWRAEKKQYETGDPSKQGDQRDERYREWDNLQYWFRAVEKYAPWYNTIHFVTYGHVPSWLNVNNPRLHIVRHQDYIPARYLPTYSARPIEFYLHKIPDLTEHFVYFNDDMFLTAPVKPEDFFVNGLPVESAILNINIPPARDVNGKAIRKDELYMSALYNVLAINRHFKKKQVIKSNIHKWFNFKYGTEQIRTLLLLPWGDFTGFNDTHYPYPLLKSTFDEVWANEAEALSTACEHKFRMPDDVSGRLMTFWQIASGKFTPRPVKDCKYFGICDDKDKNQKIYEAIQKKRYKMICINDKVSDGQFEAVRDQLKSVLEMALPETSSFEQT